MTEPTNVAVQAWLYGRPFGPGDRLPFFEIGPRPGSIVFGTLGFGIDSPKKASLIRIGPDPPKPLFSPLRQVMGNLGETIGLCHSLDQNLVRKDARTPARQPRLFDVLTDEIDIETNQPPVSVKIRLVKVLFGKPAFQDSAPRSASNLRIEYPSKVLVPLGIANGGIPRVER